MRFDPLRLQELRRAACACARCTVDGHGFAGQAGVEVARVVPVKRIPKTTSGKLQRTALAQAYENGEFAAEIVEFDAAWAAAHGAALVVLGVVAMTLPARTSLRR